MSIRYFYQTDRSQCVQSGRFCPTMIRAFNCLLAVLDCADRGHRADSRGLIPRRLVPEVVLLLVAGAVVGPFALNIAADSEAIGILRELGLGMLFLLAGYEIDRQELSGRGGRRALYTWLFCLALAFTVVALLGMRNVISAEAAVAIAMTSTALGTLLPILKDNKLLDTRLGKTVLNHGGAVGELGPVVAMAVLLSAVVPCCR